MTEEVNLLSNLYSKYNEKYFSMALIYFRLLTDEKANDFKDSNSVGNGFENNPIAMEWPSGKLNYLSKFSAIVSDSPVNFNEKNKIHCLACIPVQHTVTRRTWKEANECSFTLAQEDFPFDPAKVQVANVYMFQGVTINDNFIDEIILRNNISDFSESFIKKSEGKYPIDIIFNSLKDINFGDSITLRDYSLKFAGFVDNISTNITTSGRTVDFACRDIVGMMLDQTIGVEEFKKVAEAMVEGSLESVIRQVLTFASAGKGLIIHGIGFPSNTIKFPSNESKEVVKKNSKSRINKDMSYWDLVVDLCQLCGLTCQIEYLQYQKDIVSEISKRFVAVPSLAIYTADIAYGSTEFNKDKILNIVSEISKRYVAVPSLASQSADIAYGSTQFIKDKLLNKEFYDIDGVIKTIKDNGYYFWFNNRPLIEIGYESNEATVTKDIGSGLIPAVRVISFNDKDLNNPFIEGWFPKKMFDNVPGDFTIDKYNEAVKQVQAMGVKYFDPKSYKEINVPGIHDQKKCNELAETFYNQMIRGKNKLTLKSGRYYFSNEKQDKIIGIGNLRCGHAVSILWPSIININNSEFAEEPNFINTNNMSDEQKAYILNENPLVKIWYVTSVEYTLDPDGFNVSIELIRSLEG